MQAGNGHTTIAGCKETRNCSSTDGAWAPSTVIRTRPDGSCTTDRSRLTPSIVHELVHRGVAAHRAGRPLGDDETLVVAQLAPAREAGS